MAKLEMSSDDLRTHLYTSLRGKGILDSLKSQLRNRLATELQNSFGAVSPQRTVDKPSPQAAGKAPCAMSVQVANNIIAEHMKKAGFEYSLSVFLPEAGLNMDKLFTTEDLLHFLRIPPSSPLANSLQTSPTEHGFLVQLLEALMESTTAPTDVTQSPQQTASKAVQSDLCTREEPTSPRGFRKTSVATQLQALENAYARKAEEETQKYQQSLDDRLSEYQRDLEARYKKQLETEMNLFQTKELVKARLEERERYLREALKEREEAQEKHQHRLDDLRRNELQLKERYCKKEQELEASIYSQRQTLLTEMESLKLREAEVKRQAELDKKMLAMERERVRIREEQLAARETSLQHTANEKAQKHHSELASQLQSKERDLMKWVSEYQMDQGRLASSKSDHQVVITKLEEERRKTERLQQLLQEATDRHITLENQKGSLQQQIDQMRDYHQLKQKVSELQRCVALADRKLSEAKTEYKSRLSEQKQLLKKLQMKQAKPISELASLQDEVERLQKQHHKEMLTLEYDNKHLGKQLAVQTEYSVQLQRQLDEQLLQLKSAQREVEDLHSLVEQMKPLMASSAASKHGAKSVSAPGSKKTNMKRSSPSPRKAGLSASRGQIEPSSFDQLPSTHPPSLPSLTSTILPHSVSPAPHGGSPSSLLTFGLPSTSAAAVARVGSLTKPAALDISDTSGQFLAETRATFARLEKEAEELEKTYQSFHQKAERNESPRLREDEPLLPFHQATLVDHGSSSSDTTPDREISPTFPTSAMSLQPQGVATLLSQSPPVPVSSSLSSTTTTASSTAQTVVTSSSSAQQNFTQSLVSASHPPSSLTTVVAVAPPALSATTTPPLEVAAVSPPPPLTSGTEAKPTQTVAQQGLSTEETATKARQRLTLDDWWKKSPPLPPSSTSSKQPSNTTAVASSSSVDSSKAAAVDEGHSKSLHITEKPKIKLDDLWKNSNTVSEAHTVGGGSNTIATNSNVQNGRLSHSPPPVSIEKPKLSLDDLWRHPSPSKPPATATSAAKPTVTPSKQLKEEREEKEKLRREQQLQEQERVRKELEELERQEKLKKIEPLNHQGTVELLEHKNDSDKQQRTNSIVGQEASVEVTNKETEGGEVKKEPVGSDDNGIDPVMLKYMELVKEKREKQQKSEEAHSQFPPRASVKKDSSGDKDFGVPSLSQATDSFGGFSDNENEGDPFEDW